MDREDIPYTAKSYEHVNSTDNVTSRILKRDSNSIRLSLVTLIFVAFFFALLLFCVFPNLFFELAPELRQSMLAFFVIAVSDWGFRIGFVFFLFPLFSGVILFAKFTVDGIRPSLADIFIPFKRGKWYFRSILVPIIILLRTALVVLPLVGGIASLSIFGENAKNELIIFTSAFEICLVIAAITVGAYISSFFYFIPYLMLVEDKGFFGALRTSFDMSRGKRVEIVKSSLRDLFDVVLSLMSFMVLFVVYAMPRMSVSYFVYCERVARSEDICDE